MEAEELFYELNIPFFASSDLLLPLIKMCPEFKELIDKYGGNTILAIEFLEKHLDNLSELEHNDDYFVINYSVEEWSNYRNL